MAIAQPHFDALTSSSLQVVTVLKREVMRTQSKELERAFEYRQLLVQAIHKCAIKFPDVAGNVLHLLMGKLSTFYRLMSNFL